MKQELTTIGTYSKQVVDMGKPTTGYGVWAQIMVDVAGRRVAVDIKLTEPMFSTPGDADLLAIQLRGYSGVYPELLTWDKVDFADEASHGLIG